MSPLEQYAILLSQVAQLSYRHTLNEPFDTSNLREAINEFENAIYWQGELVYNHTQVYVAMSVATLALYVKQPHMKIFQRKLNQLTPLLDAQVVDPTGLVYQQFVIAKQYIDKMDEFLDYLKKGKNWN